MDRNITSSPMIWMASCMANVDGSIWTTRAVSSLPRACGYWSRPKHTTFHTTNAIRMLYVSPFFPHKATHIHLGSLGKSWTRHHNTEAINSLNSKGHFIPFIWFWGSRGQWVQRWKMKIALCFPGYSFLVALSPIWLRGHANLLYSILCHHVIYIYRAIGVNQQP